MKTSEDASLTLLKILLVTVLLIFVLGISVMAFDTNINNVKIQFSNSSSINILTTKTKVSEILEENHIILLPDETVFPALEENITDNKIVITKKGETPTKIASENENISIEEIVTNYAPIVEKIIVIEEEIPFETITKDVSNKAKKTTNRVLQQGQKGIREVTYKVKYRNDEEISREEISSEIIKKPVDKIVQVSANTVTSRSSATTRMSYSTLAKKVEGIEPTVKTMNASAYTASTCGKSPSSPGYGRTASGAMASAWYTIAAGSGYKMGTIMYIPYFKDEPNGGWFVVQDRGGAISNSKIDVYMDTYNECIQFGRRNLTCYIYEI